jgi:type IV fimbrial biogenesis protein FimT
METIRRRGFTLIELMIGLAIFAFLIMIAGPQYVDFLGNSQIRNGAENTLTGLRLAQTEAIRGNTQAQFVLDSATGWQVSRLNDETGTFDVVQSYKFSDGAAKTTVTTLPGDATEVTFNGLGRVMDPNPDASAPIKLVDVTNTNVSTANRRPLRIAITSFATSGVKLCDPAVTDTSDPRFCPAS